MSKVITLSGGKVQGQDMYNSFPAVFVITEISRVEKKEKKTVRFSDGPPTVWEVPGHEEEDRYGHYMADGCRRHDRVVTAWVRLVSAHVLDYGEE